VVFPETQRMSIANIETLIRSAREQHSQLEINAGMLKAVAALMREVKRLENDLHSARRAANRRF
jgi:hypothetical protein